MPPPRESSSISARTDPTSQLLQAQQDILSHLEKISEMLEGLPKNISQAVVLHGCIKVKELEDISTRLTKIEVREKSVSDSASESRSMFKQWQERQDTMLLAHDQVVYKVTGGWKTIVGIAAAIAFTMEVIMRVLPVLIK